MSDPVIRRAIEKIEELKETRKELRETRKHLKDLCDATSAFLKNIDNIMAYPANFNRGVAIGQACNRLDMARQIAERYGLGKGRNDTTRTGASDDTSRTQ
jgi:hypothetical protein